MKHWCQSYPGWTLFLALVLLLSYFCILRVWITYRHTSLGRRIAWTFICMLPLIGPLFYGALFKPLESHKDGDRCPPTPGIGAPGMR